MTALDNELARIRETRPRIIDLSLDRVKLALSKLGDPHLSLPPVFHVAGTNGKGSTIAFLRSILEAAGSSVHAYTSPHLVRFNERIVLAGAEASDQMIIDCLKACDDAVGEASLTYFEIITCAAFLAFTRVEADFLLLEVGLGGRLDATNVIDAPAASLITPVDFDHQHFLGDTIEEIASEKAGVIKSGAPVFIGPQRPAASQVLRSRADELGAPVFAFGTEWDVWSEHGRLIYQDEAGLSDLPEPRLLGRHQFYNAGLAIAAAKAVVPNISEDQLAEGLKNARWPARMQRLQQGPLVEQAVVLTGDGVELWLDGGHNPHAARTIAETMASLQDKAVRRVILVTGMQDQKDAAGFLSAFEGVASHVFAVSADLETAASPNAIATAAEQAGIPASICSSVEDAIDQACRHQEAPPRILICGSLYLAGEILKTHQ